MKNPLDVVGIVDEVFKKSFGGNLSDTPTLLRMSVYLPLYVN